MPSKDPEKIKLYRKRHYEKHKKAVQERVNELRRLNKTKWIEFKSTLACEACGAAHPAIIDFHHPPDAMADKKDVNRLVGDNKFGQAYAEVKRCVVLCSNCHRIHHYREHQAFKAIRRAQGAPTDDDDSSPV